jgi:23S rRNA (guanosine2251-2'-O)-methyltransferase
MKRRHFANRDAPPAPGYLYGVHPIAAWLRCRPERLRVLHYDAQAAPRLEALLQAATAAGVALSPCNAERLRALVGEVRHQGVVAGGSPFPYAALEAILPAAPRLLLAADHIQDPQNLGALLRTAAAVGAGAVLVPRDAAVAVTAAVEASAAGAAARVPVCRVGNLVRALTGLKEQGYWSVGLLPRAGVDLYRFEPPARVLLVVGGESGMRALVVRRCDWRVSIPMRGETESLNAAVAAAVAAYEIWRRWEHEGAA